MAKPLRPPRPGRRPLPPPRSSGPASVLSSVRRMANSREKPFDPERSYPRETKPHHFSVNARESSLLQKARKFCSSIEEESPIAPKRTRRASTAPVASSKNAPERILEAFDNLDAATGQTNYVKLYDLRQALPDLSRAAFDEGINQLRRERILTLDSSDGRHERLPKREMDAGIIEQGNTPLVFAARRMNNNSGDEFRDEIVEGAARAFFVSAWADAAEEAGHEFAGGTQLEDVAPETPEEVMEFARQFITSVEKVNRKSIDSLYLEHLEAAGNAADADAERFGWYIAMPAMGHGVHWYDDYPEPPSGPIRLPDVEFHVSVDPDDIDSTSVDFSEISERLAR